MKSKDTYCNKGIGYSLERYGCDKMKKWKVV